MEVAHKGMVSLDALILPVDPFLQRDRDAANSTAIANGITVMEAELMAEHVDVENVPVADVEADA